MICDGVHLLKLVLVYTTVPTRLGLWCSNLPSVMSVNLIVLAFLYFAMDSQVPLDLSSLLSHFVHHALCFTAHVRGLAEFEFKVWCCKRLALCCELCYWRRRW